MPRLLFGDKEPDKQLVITVNLGIILMTEITVPDIPTQLATESLRGFLVLIPSFLWMGWDMAKIVSSRLSYPVSEFTNLNAYIPPNTRAHLAAIIAPLGGTS